MFPQPFDKDAAHCARFSQLSVKLREGRGVKFPGDLEVEQAKVQNVIWELSGFCCIGTVVLTNFRAVLIPGEAVPGLTTLPMRLEIPWGVVDSITMLRSATRLRTTARASQLCDTLQFHCLDFRTVRLTWGDRSKGSCSDGPVSNIERLHQTVSGLHEKRESLSKEFVQAFGPTDLWSVFSWEDEFRRQGFEEKKWRMTDANHNYDLCASYPACWRVPSSVTDDVVERAAKSRTKNRCALVTWRHKQSGSLLLRGAQPRYGENDAVYIEAIRKTVGAACNLVFFDCRSYAAASANVVNRGGTERPETYAWNCGTTETRQPEMLQLDIDNIHAMRSSWQSLKRLIDGSVPESTWFACLHETKWLHHCRTVVEAAHTVARSLHCSCAKKLCTFRPGQVDVEQSVVVVHCSDGWDRTSQVVSLAQLLLDPYYRTSKGFCTLIEKDWVRFGHKFHDRVTGDDPNGRAPIFLQWLFCVAAVLNQFPQHFEFSDENLRLLLDLWLSGWTGSFKRNTEQECCADSNTEVSIWAVWLQCVQSNSLFRTPSASPGGKASERVRLLTPVTSLKKFALWPWVFRFDEVDLQPLHVEFWDMQHSLQNKLWPPENVCWTMDSSVSACGFCGRDFTSTLRKHHCRACGQIFCSASTCLTKAKIEHLYGDRKVYVCHKCSELRRRSDAIYGSTSVQQAVRRGHFCCELLQRVRSPLMPK